VYYDRGNETDAEHGLWVTAHVHRVGHVADFCVPLVGRRRVPSHTNRTRLNKWAEEKTKATPERRFLK